MSALQHLSLTRRGVDELGSLGSVLPKLNQLTNLSLAGNFRWNASAAQLSQDQAESQSGAIVPDWSHRAALSSSLRGHAQSIVKGLSCLTALRELQCMLPVQRHLEVLSELPQLTWLSLGMAEDSSSRRDLPCDRLTALQGLQLRYAFAFVPEQLACLTGLQHLDLTDVHTHQVGVYDTEAFLAALSRLL
jgi:hypothetical protein